MKFKDTREKSVRLTLRLPERLHKSLAAVAELSGCSLNYVIVYYLDRCAPKKKKD